MDLVGGKLVGKESGVADERYILAQDFNGPICEEPDAEKRAVAWSIAARRDLPQSAWLTRLRVRHLGQPLPIPNPIAWAIEHGGQRSNLRVDGCNGISHGVVF